MAEFHADHEAPFGYVGLAFPSAKDPSYHERNPDRCTCAVVAGDVPWDWFEKWQSTKVRHRGQDYEAFKKSFEERLLDILYTQYPQTKGRVEYVNMGTPLDTNFYLGKHLGESGASVEGSLLFGSKAVRLTEPPSRKTNVSLERFRPVNVNREGGEKLDHH
ncbi:14-dihydroretinol saturase) (RetSat) (PPAR-alpha-regulated and starvation-induced gene protein) [Durusdinium trenchii]|uniref:14-dihydroretinol saturase (RetSat (PPAR-alpha-regulated and starvation-induced gene protein n=1 Tax=Durusdinium trenchii TaxID=1381693 RepID=A0ABP0HUW9_9DINO